MLIASYFFPFFSFQTTLSLPPSHRIASNIIRRLSRLHSAGESRTTNSINRARPSVRPSRSRPTEFFPPRYSRGTSDVPYYRDHPAGRCGKAGENSGGKTGLSPLRKIERDNIQALLKFVRPLWCKFFPELAEGHLCATWLKYRPLSKTRVNTRFKFAADWR